MNKEQQPPDPPRHKPPLLRPAPKRRGAHTLTRPRNPAARKALDRIQEKADPK